MNRQQLEALEENNPLAFYREVEKFASGRILTKDNYDDFVWRMLDAAEGPLVNEDGSPLTTEIITVIRDGFNTIPFSHDTKIGVLMLLAVFIVAGIMLAAVPFVSKVSEVVR